MDTNSYLETYRKSLDDQYNAAQAALNQQRENDYTNIMSAANKSGALYSNFPERSKIQYETQTYMPTFQKNYTTYQTAKDKIRSNIADYQNQIDAINKAIADLNADKAINQSYY